MNAETAAFYILDNTAGVNALVGATGSSRIYLGRRKQTAPMPAISIEPNGINPTDQKPGQDTGVSRLDVADILVFCYGATFTDAQNLAIAVRAALDKKAGGTYNNVVVQSVQFMSEDYFDEGLDPFYYVFEHSYRFRIVR
jgi:hypothetical protein